MYGGGRGEGRRRIFPSRLLPPLYLEAALALVEQMERREKKRRRRRTRVRGLFIEGKRVVGGGQVRAVQKWCGWGGGGSLLFGLVFNLGFEEEEWRRRKCEVVCAALGVVGSSGDIMRPLSK